MYKYCLRAGMKLNKANGDNIATAISGKLNRVRRQCIILFCLGNRSSFTTDKLTK